MGEIGRKITILDEYAILRLPRQGTGRPVVGPDEDRIVHHHDFCVVRSLIPRSQETRLDAELLCTRSTEECGVPNSAVFPRSPDEEPHIGAPPLRTGEVVQEGVDHEVPIVGGGRIDDEE